MTLTATRALRQIKHFPALNRGDFPWARSSNPLTDGELVAALARHPQYERLVGTLLTTVDQELARRRGPAPATSCATYELLALYRVAAGQPTNLETITTLTSRERRRDRAALGLLETVHSITGAIHWLVPQRRDVDHHWRTRGRRYHDRLLAAYTHLHQQLVADYLHTHQHGLDQLYLDCTASFTRYTTAIYARSAPPGTPRTPLNADKITAEGSYRTGDKQGHGWHVASITNHHGIPLLLATAASEIAEPRLGLTLIKRLPALRRHIHRTEPWLGTLTADGAFSTRDIRHALLDANFLPNIHFASHRDDPVTTRANEARVRRTITIDGYPGWHFDGHRELHCRCGRNTTRARYDFTHTGKLRARLEGRCTTCPRPHPTITAGRWRWYNNKKAIRRAEPGTPKQDLDPSFGIPLTYNDPRSHQLGTRRFGHQEGFYGATKLRFNTNYGRSWHRKTSHVELANLRTACLVLAACAAP